MSINKNRFFAILFTIATLVSLLPDAQALVPAGFNEKFDTIPTGAFSSHTGYTFSNNGGTYNVTAPGLVATTNALYLPDTSTPAVATYGIVTLQAPVTPSLISFDMQIVGNAASSQASLQFSDSGLFPAPGPNVNLDGSAFAILTQVITGTVNIRLGVQAAGCGTSSTSPLLTTGQLSHHYNLTVNWTSHFVSATVDNGTAVTGFFLSCSKNNITQIALTDGQPTVPAANWIVDNFNMNVAGYIPDVTSNFSTNFPSNKLVVSSQYSPLVFVQALVTNNTAFQSGLLYKADKNLSFQNQIQYCNHPGSSDPANPGNALSANVPAEIAIGNDNELDAPCLFNGVSPNANYGSINDLQFILDSSFNYVAAIQSEAYYSTGTHDMATQSNRCYILKSPDYNSNLTTLHFISNGALAINAPITGGSSCFIDKITHQLITSGDAGIRLYSVGGNLIASNNLPIGGNSAVFGANAFSISGTLSTVLRKYVYSSGSLNPVTNVTTSVVQDRLYISPDGQYTFTWNDALNSVVQLYLNSNMSLIANITYPGNYIKSCGMDVANNYLFCSSQDQKIYRADLYGYTTSTGGQGNSTNGTLNPPPLPNTVAAPTNTSTTITSSVTIQPGGNGGGYVGNGTSFFGLDIAYLSTQFHIDAIAMKWLLGILVVSLVVYGLRKYNIIVTAVGCLLGVGLAITFGLFPIWLLLVLVLLLIYVVANIGGGGETEE